MPGPSIIEFARMADACYYAAERLLPLSTRIHFGQLPSGFKGSHYRSDTGGSLVTVVAFAGTDGGDTEFTDSGDKLADLGFAGSLVGGAVGVLGGPLMAGLAQWGAARLNAQVSDALELVKQAQAFAAPGAPIYLTGHSLGGGLAQIIAAKTGLKGVAFNGPAVSQLGYRLADPRGFVNVNLRSDPVSAGTSNFGKHLGETVTIDSGDGIADAHFLGRIIAALEAGPNKGVGDRKPF